MDISILSQPDDETCGPTSLQAVYYYYGDSISLSDVIAEVPRITGGGTLAAQLGSHAIGRGYDAHLYVYDLNLFDPTWFTRYSAKRLIRALQKQMQHKRDPKFVESSEAYIDFLKAGGVMHYRNLSADLLKKYLKKRIPIITGLSATYLYGTAREISNEKGKSIYDAIRGYPCGHFVVLSGNDLFKRYVIVADPHRENPLSHDNYYRVKMGRLLNAIMLGVMTYDANLLIISPIKGTL